MRFAKLKENMKIALIKANMTQRELSELSGLSVATINRYVNNPEKMTIEVCARLQKVLNANFFDGVSPFGNE